jgi:uncharacterized protein (UPF0333 family)
MEKKIGLSLLFVLLLLSSVGSHAIWSGKKDSDDTAPSVTESAKAAVNNVGESIKQTANAAYETTANAARTVTGGRSEHASDTPTGAAYRDRAGNYVADTATATQRRAAEAAASVRGTAANSAQAARDTAARAYDATANTLGSAKDRVWGAPEPEPTYTQRAAEAARRAHQNVRDGASRAYDATTSPFSQEDNRGMYERARDTVYGAGQATRDSGYRAMGYEPPSERSYAGRAYDSFRDSSHDAYEAGKNRLGSIVEILGWRRVPDEEEHTGPMTASLGRYHSPYDVMVGNTRYVWGKHPEEPESYYQSARNAAGRATQTVSETAGRTKDATLDTANRASETVKQTANKASESVKQATDKASESVKEMAEKTGVDKLTKDSFLRKLWRFVHLVTWGVAFGAAVWMTFMSGRVLSQNMPREQFRTVQTKMFPSYLRFLTAAEGVLAFLYTFLTHSSKWQTLNLLFLVGTTAYNAYVLEPQTTKLYLDRLRLEKEEGKGLNPGDHVSEELDEKNKKFKELHGYSATLNLLSLAGLTYHAWNMVSRVYV